MGISIRLQTPSDSANSGENMWCAIEYGTEHRFVRGGSDDGEDLSKSERLEYYRKG